VAIANALQLEAARATPALSRFNYTMPFLTSLNLSIAILYRFCCWYITLCRDLDLWLWPWPLTFDIKHLQRIVCDVVKLYTKSERNRTIRGGVIALSVIDLMTLNMFCVLRSALG